MPEFKPTRKTIYTSPLGIFNAVPVPGYYRFAVYYICGKTPIKVATIDEESATVDINRQNLTKVQFADLSALISGVMDEYC